MLLIYTIGSSNRGINKFIELLKDFNINLILDVRRFPTSKRFPPFKKTVLKQYLNKHEIDYIFLGNQLGGFRKEGYEKFMKTSIFIQGLNKLENEAKKAVSAIMCAEKYPWKCHRKHISLKLEKRGWKVVHILDKNKTRTNKIK